LPENGAALESFFWPLVKVTMQGTHFKFAPVPVVADNETPLGLSTAEPEFFAANSTWSWPEL
jgi:hypothetical protein